MAKILVVEDDQSVTEAISDALSTEGHIVESVGDGLAALKRLENSGYDIVLLDLGLPELGGDEVCIRYRNSGGQLPILMITARNTVLDRTSGLDSGADDYLAKPFSVDELCARVRALLRRAGDARSNQLKVGRLIFDLKTRRVYKDKEEIKLLPKELDVLEFLMRNKGQVFSVESLLRRVWQSDANVSMDACRQCLARLRKRIDSEGEPSLISTVMGLGYRIDD